MPNSIYIHPYPPELCVFLGTTVLGGWGTLLETGVRAQIYRYKVSLADLAKQKS
jgi:hypothetical protein